MVTNKDGSNKIAVFVLADTKTEEDLGRLVNALVAVKEFKDAGDEARLYFDGIGTRWLQELNKSDHKARGLYESVKDRVAGACLFCAAAFGAKASVQECKVELVNEFEQHVSTRSLISDGYQIINF